MRVMIVGSSGLLAAAISREFAADELHPFSRAALDVTDAAAVAGAVARVSPDAVINCAAYNNVDGAEDHATDALQANSFAVLALTRACAAHGARLVHYSTDFVFDGGASRPYTEEDHASPRSVYGASKLLGEWFALEHPGAYVLRVESLFGRPGPHGGRHGSLASIIDKIRAGVEVPVFTDRTVSPGYTTDIARATRALLTLGAPAGLYHCVNSGHATWAEVATVTADLLGLPIHLAPITLASVNLKARRPLYCALSNEKLAAAGVTMPDWQDAIGRYVSEIQPPG